MPGPQPTVFRHRHNREKDWSDSSNANKAAAPPARVNSRKAWQPKQQSIGPLSAPGGNALVNLFIRKAFACWEGGAKGGTRMVTTESNVLRQVKVSADGLRKVELGTGPAELIAAAHASSFSLALSHQLGLQASAVGEIVTTATVTMEHLAAGWSIISMHLDVIARLPVTQNAFIDAAVRAKTTCLISNILRVKISMNAKLESDSGGAAKGAW